MFGAELGEDSGLGGKNIEEVPGPAASCIVAGEEEQFDLAHCESLEGLVHDRGLLAFIFGHGCR